MKFLYLHRRFRLKCELDPDLVAAGAGVFHLFLINLDPLDERPEQLGRELGHLNILFCFRYEFVDTVLLDLDRVDLAVKLCKLCSYVRLFLLVDKCILIVFLRGDPPYRPVLVESSEYAVKLSEP